MILDSGFLSAAMPAPGGGVRVPARVARTGTQRYLNPDGSFSVDYRPPEEVFAQESLDSLLAAPLIIDHVPEVTPGNWREVARGTVAALRGKSVVDGNEWVEVHLAISDAAALSALESRPELSCGYTCERVDEPGIAPDGTRYDRVQRNIRYNHVALLPTGKARAGRESRIHDEKDHMKFTYDSIDFDLSSEADIKSLARTIEQRDAKHAAEIAALRSDAEKLTAELAATKTVADSIDSRVGAELAFRDKLRPILGTEHMFTSRSESLRAAASKLAPKANVVADASDEYLTAFVDALIARGVENYTTTEKVEDSVDSNNAAHIARLRSCYKDSFK